MRIHSSRAAFVAGVLFASPSLLATEPSLDVVAVTVTPHVQAPGMRYARDPDPRLGAWVQIFLQNQTNGVLRIPPQTNVLFRGQTPEELLAAGEWTWADVPSSWPEQDLMLPAGAMTVWQFNSRDDAWGVNTTASLRIDNPAGAPLAELEFFLANPERWISAATFLGDPGGVSVDRLILHVANASERPMRIDGCRLWVPASNETWRSLTSQEVVLAGERFPTDGVIPPRDKGGAVFPCAGLPLSYAVIEVRCWDGEPFSLWTHLRVKRESFDISGGWVVSNLAKGHSLQCEPYLKTLRRMHIDTAHIGEVAGYTDQDGPEGLYTRYPLKYFNKLTPFDRFDVDAVLPRIHAVEFLGEPQYGGGRPVPPMEVWKALAPYQSTRLPTSLTHSEERIWRYYAGLSDFPHYDAYRVSAPSPDAWWKYDRWQGKKLWWGAPLETIGEMSRSLRELNRPRPTAYWSQGPHKGWDVYGGRRRTSPTPDELRLQAYHALASRITSLYWFNLSLGSLVKFPDLIDEVTRVGREIRLLDEFYLEGDAYEYRRVDRDGSPDWDLASISSPRALLLFALDLAYTPDPKERVFRFGPPRKARFVFRLPAHLRSPAEVFRIDADGVFPVRNTCHGDTLEIDGDFAKVAIFVVAKDSGVMKQLETRRQELIDEERAFSFDPANQPEDLDALRSILDGAP